MKKFKKVALKILYAFIIFIGFTALFSANWYIGIYGKTGFDSILFTLFGNIGGVESGLIVSYLLKGLLPSVIVTLLVCLVLFYNGKKSIFVKRKGESFKIYPFKPWLVTTISVTLSAFLFIYSAISVGFVQWAFYSIESTTLYEDEYIFPSNTEITAPENKRNLIYIFLESMETTYFSKDLGGAMPENLIPELYDLAKENINFSQNSDVGGWTATPRTSWTTASIVAQTSGMVVTSEEATADKKVGILPSAVTLMDILNKEGYYQTLMVGSDASFGSRDMYFLQHSCDKVYDLFTARKDGIVPKDYYQWWGIEDKHLYRYAKEELLKISKSNSPFAFTMLTVDTHHVDGYFCSECKNEHSEQYSNVISCASRQLNDFVNWIKQQDFYENTTIVICGDHRSMGSEYFSRNVDPTFDRRIYNCIINSAVTPINSKNRVFTPMDMFPTTLAAMGFEIKGNRLALGVNLFSNEPTLSEKYGKDYIDAELLKNSTFYKVNFLRKP